MTRFIKTKRGGLLLCALGVGAACGAAAFALVLVTPQVGAVQVSVLLLLVSAALMKSPASAGEGTRALVPACVRVGRPAGSALRRAAIGACTHEGQGDTVSPRRQSIIPLLRVGR